MTIKEHEDKYIHINKKTLIRALLTLIPITYFILFFIAGLEQPFTTGLSVGTEIDNMTIWLFERYPITMVWMIVSCCITMLLLIGVIAFIWDDDK